MTIATKTGDNGTTSLAGGGRVPKDHPVIECLGTIDELNSFLGDAKAALLAGDPSKPQTGETITGIQKDLFAVSGLLAGGADHAAGILKDGEKRLTALIAELEAGRPRLAAFSVPGDSPVSAKLHIARAVCRRAERRLVSLNRAGELPGGILPWFNRLSDLLFLLARE